jgi:predicted RNA-binding Zn-ribbon protein involved in translation (DUF1610 family)
MKWPSWLKLIFRHKPVTTASLTQCPKCGKEMILMEKTTFSGDDMRTYRCDHCREEHILNLGTALWKALADARESEKDVS